MAEEALRETGERLRLAQAAGGVGTWEWNATTDEANWSAQAWELFEPGGSGDVTYERWLRVIHPDDLMGCIERWTHSGRATSEP